MSSSKLSTTKPFTGIMNRSFQTLKHSQYLSGGLVDGHAPSPGVSKVPQGNERGTMGSKNPPCILEPLFFSARHRSRNPGFVLRPLSPICHCLAGRCVRRRTASFVLNLSIIPYGYNQLYIIYTCANRFSSLQLTLPRSEIRTS